MLDDSKEIWVNKNGVLLDLVGAVRTGKKRPCYWISFNGAVQFGPYKNKFQALLHASWLLRMSMKKANWTRAEAR